MSALEKESPEFLTCHACGLKVQVRWSKEDRDGQVAEILHVGHYQPICPTFDAMEDPLVFINDARAGAQKAHDA